MSCVFRPRAAVWSEPRLKAPRDESLVKMSDRGLLTRSDPSEMPESGVDSDLSDCEHFAANADCEALRSLLKSAEAVSISVPVSHFHFNWRSQPPAHVAPQAGYDECSEVSDHSASRKEGGTSFANLPDSKF